MLLAYSLKTRAANYCAKEVNVWFGEDVRILGKCLNSLQNVRAVNSSNRLRMRLCAIIR